MDLRAVHRATALLHHRGPDDEGYLLVRRSAGTGIASGGRDTDHRLNLPAIGASYGQAFDLAFGFRRLAILDPSPAGHQPMGSPDGRFWIVFNGEIYNFLELRDQLAGHGFRFHTGTDTEVILAAYQQWGVECLSRFNGMWALAIWDNNAKSLFLARDRFGVKPLYYVSTENTFAFASEIKALVGQHGIQFQPDDEAIYRYLAAGLLPSPQLGDTFFRQVRSLPPGCWMDVREGRVSAPKRYWRLPAAADGVDRGTADRAIREYRDLFVDAVGIRLRSDVPVGTCLSGGLDSSSIVCVINQLLRENSAPAQQVGSRQKTFSAVYEEEDTRYNERQYVDRVLTSTGADGKLVFPDFERLATDLGRLIWHQDEPFPSTSMFAQWCVMSRAAEEGVKVLLDGQGADEALAGYRPFAAFLGDLLRHARFGRMVSEIAAIRRRTGESTLRLLAGTMARQGPTQLMGYWRRRRKSHRVSTSVLNRDFEATYDRARSDGRMRWTYEDLQSHLRDAVEDSSLPHLLRYEDRNSMAFSVEARVPFLDYRLMEMSFGEAAPWRINDGWTKWILRKAMDGIVPSEIAWRRDKVGFETPEAAWLGKLLSDLPHLFDDGSPAQIYLNLPRVRETIGTHSLQTISRHVWRWINLQLWLQVWT